MLSLIYLINTKVKVTIKLQSQYSGTQKVDPKI